MNLHGFDYEIVTLDGHHVAYPTGSFGTPDAEQCDCLHTAVDFYRLKKEVLYSEGEPVLSIRDTEIIDALLLGLAGLPRPPRNHSS